MSWINLALNKLFVANHSENLEDIASLLLVTFFPCVFILVSHTAENVSALSLCLKPSVLCYLPTMLVTGTGPCG